MISYPVVYATISRKLEGQEEMNNQLSAICFILMETQKFMSISSKIPAEELRIGVDKKKKEKKVKVMEKKASLLIKIL
jgi:hypothetical protein